MDGKERQTLPAGDGSGQEREAPESPAPKEAVRYASPLKRLWAWVGVVYMVGLTLLTTYGMAHGGVFLSGIGSLMVIPALAGLGGTVILRHREGKGRGGAAVCALLSGACFLLCVINLVRGTPILLAQLLG